MLEVEISVYDPSYHGLAATPAVSAFPHHSLYLDAFCQLGYRALAV